MDAKQLLSELDLHNYHQRWQMIVKLVKDIRDEGRLQKLQDELEHGDLFAKYVNLQISIVSRNGDRVMECLKSDSRLLRSTAASVCLDLCKDATALQSTLMTAPYSLQKQLLKRIGSTGATELAERIVADLPVTDVARIAWLLPACRESTVRRFLDKCAPHIASWPRLSMRHPDAVFDFIEAKFRTVAAASRRWLWHAYHKAIETLVSADRNRVVVLLEKFCESVEHLPPQLQALLLRLYPHYPQRIADVGLSANSLKAMRRHGVPFVWKRRIACLSDQHLEVLVRALLPKSALLAFVLRRLAPSRRRALLSPILDDKSAGCDWSEAFLLELPHDLRHQQVRNLLNGKRRPSRARALRLTALLPYDEALPDLQNAYRASKAEERSTAYALLVQCAFTNRRAADALTELTRTKNEQDPVRQEIFAALATISPAHLTDTLAEFLDTLISHAFDAPDISFATHHAIQQLLVKMLVYAPHEKANDEQKVGLRKLSLKFLGDQKRRNDYIGFPSLEIGLPRGVEYDIVDACAELAYANKRSERFRLVVELASSLGRRGWGVPKLQELLRDALDAHDKNTRAVLINFWIQDPKTRDERIEQLLLDDASVIALPSVFLHAHRRRQDLLDHYLSGNHSKGHFRSGRTTILMLVDRGFHRWLPRQQRAFATLIDRWLTSKSVTDDERRIGLRIRATLHTTSLSDFAKPLKSSQVAIVEGALAALPNLDRAGEGIPRLLDHLGSDRARVAMYAMRRCLRELGETQQFELLSDLLDAENQKITVQKETIRLLGGIRSPQGSQKLLAHASRDGLHRDVRIALGHAACQLLPDGNAWQILDQIVSDPRPEVLVSLLETDATAMNTSDRRRFTKLLLTFADHPSEVVRKTLFVQSHRWLSGQAAAFAKAAATRISQLDGSPEWKAAVQCLANCAQYAKARSHLQTLTKDLVNAPLEPNADTERDCPALQRLHALVDTLVQQYFWHGPAADWIKEPAEYLIENENTNWLGVRLALIGVDWNKPRGHRQLEELCRVVESQPFRVGQFVDLIQQKLHRVSVSTKLLSLVDNLTTSSSTVARLAATTVLVVVGNAQNWPEACRSRLVRFRNDEHEAVRNAAYSYFTCVEDEDEVRDEFDEWDWN